MKSKIIHIKKQLNQIALCFLLAAHFAQVGNYIPPSFRVQLSLDKTSPLCSLLANVLKFSDESDNSNEENQGQHHMENANSDTLSDVFEDEIDTFFALVLHPHIEPSYAQIFYKDTYCEQPHPEFSSPPPRLS
ncbi:MAG: hypothetical protein ACK4R6_01180 [Spirosomataceae bacterium]